MKKIYLGVAILFYLILQVSAVPKIEPYVNDFAHLLTSDEIAQLNLQADAIEQNTTYEIAIVTIQNTEGQDRIEYANKIGDENGVGKKGKDNGVVVLWSVEDGGAIATGRFSESILNDAKVVRIGKAARPYFNNKQYYQAFSYILTQLGTEIQIAQTENKTSSTSKPSSSDNNWPLLIIVAIGLIWIFIKVFGVGRGSILSGITLGSISTSSSSGGSSFGSGSFAGGGGKF